MKFLTVLLGIFVASSAFADDVAVAERVTCADIQASITELSEIEEPDEDVIDELTRLKADFRRSCQRTARGRKTSASSRVVIEAEKNPEEKQEVKEEILGKEEQPKKEEKKSEPEKKDVAQETVIDDTDEVEVKVEDKTDTSPDVVKETTEEVSEQSEEVEEEIVLSEEDEVEEIKKNLEAGLCADGTQPNKYGCCGDELFKDMGNTTFACCPKDGGDCFPPIK